jgi:hypothetical protein
MKQSLIPSKAICSKNNDNFDFLPEIIFFWRSNWNCQHEIRQNKDIMSLGQKNKIEHPN